MEKKWWHKTVGYQIYPKSFQDTNGDGIGDLKGVIRHLDKIEKLGANVIWLCPVFASPMVDNGYDISDYMDIDPSFGTMEDMKELIAEAKKRGIRILMDLVVNHSSDRHAWFQAALKDPFGKYGKYYVFREGKDGKEPNNWRSIFGGSAWEKVPGYDNLYYLHIFTKEQPDLNWENPKLREEIYEMILKWMDLGLGGFRLDAISHLKKNYQYTNLPPDGPDEYNMAFEYFNNVDGLADILCEMKERTFAPTDALTIGEYDHMGPEDVEDVIGENGSFSSVFDFCHTLDNVRNPKWGNTVALFDDYRDQLFAAQKIVDGRGMLCNFLENHDKPRSHRPVPDAGGPEPLQRKDASGHQFLPAGYCVPVSGTGNRHARRPETVHSGIRRQTDLCYLRPSDCRRKNGCGSARADQPREPRAQQNSDAVGCICRGGIHNRYAVVPGE